MQYARNILKQINHSVETEVKGTEETGDQSQRSKKEIIKTARSLIQQCKTWKENNWEPDIVDNYERFENDDDQYNDYDILNDLNHVTGVQPTNPIIGRK